ncbi:MAG: hypothetical protein IJ927_03890 [Eubacterium sp.]|nr:hypothetical protein [Eubacterium sp.]
MNTKLFSKQNIMCAVAMIIIVASYAAQRILELVITPGKNVALLISIIYIILLAVVFYLISKSNNTFFGLLTALIGYKMMPPPVTYLSQTIDGQTLYSLVCKAAAIVFVVVIYKLYKSQSEPHEIRSMTLLAILLSVPFFNKVSQIVTTYFYVKTGNMLYCYFTQYILYALAILFIVIVAYKCGYSSLKFAACFEYTALSINIVRVASKVCYLAISKQHISKSLYAWIAVYAVLIVFVAVVTNIQKKKELTA